MVQLLVQLDVLFSTIHQEVVKCTVCDEEVLEHVVGQVARQEAEEVASDWLG